MQEPRDLRRNMLHIVANLSSGELRGRISPSHSTVLGSSLDTFDFQAHYSVKGVG